MVTYAEEGNLSAVSFSIAVLCVFFPVVNVFQDGRADQAEFVLF